MSNLIWIIVAVVAVIIVLFVILAIVQSSKDAKAEADRNLVWKDRKRTFLGLPWSFTRYSLAEDRLFISKGFFNIVEDEIRLYRVLDVNYKASFGQRIFGVGSIIITSSDKSAGNIEIRSVKKPKTVKEMISKNVEAQRDKKRVVNREMMGMVDTDDDEGGI